MTRYDDFDIEDDFQDLHFELTPSMKQSMNAVAQWGQKQAGLLPSLKQDVSFNPLSKAAWESMIRAVPSVLESLKNLQKVFQELYAIDVSRVMETLRKCYQIEFENYFADIKTAVLILNERKEQLLALYKTWGSMGWTQIPTMRITLFASYQPKSVEDADRYLLSALAKETSRPIEDCEKEVLEEWRAETIRYNPACEEDVTEAYLDYFDGRYKSCVSLVFPIIEGRVIRSLDLAEKRRLPVSAKAMKDFETLNLTPEEYEKAILQYVADAALFEALKSYFAHGNNFQVQPDLINRNFIGHGMLEGKVTKMECVKLLLLLLNLEYFLKEKVPVTG